MAVTPAEAMRFEDTATEDEFAAYLAAYDAAQEQEPNPARFRDLFLIVTSDSPRRIPVVAIIGVNADLSHILDGLWCFVPGQRGAVWKRNGEAFSRTAAAIRAELTAELAAA